MHDFTFHNSTKIVFGKNSIDQLKELSAHYNRIVITYGGGSIKSSGLYDKVKSLLGGKIVGEFGGIEPNPEYETCMKAVKLVKEVKADFILAVGGGSVLDGTKFIAFAAMLPEGTDAWKAINWEAGTKAVPLGSIMTLAATGSEMNGGAVISRRALDLKNVLTGSALYPVFSILDPRQLYTLPKKQLQNGVADTLVHVLEIYATKNAETFIQDRQSEALLITLIELGEKIVALADKKDKTEDDYNLMATFFWTSTNAINGLLASGVNQDWSTHFIGHQLTALYGLDHGQTLAIVLFGVWEHAYDIKKHKLAMFAERVLGVKSGSEDDKAKTTMKEVENFFHKIGVKTRLSDYGITGADVPAKVASFFDGQKFGDADITKVDVEKIIKLRM